LEEFFCAHLEKHIKESIDKHAKPIVSALDKPDFAIKCGDKVIAAELSQVPSNYIIRHFHRSGPPPTYKKNEIVGRLSVFPFEPHRWAHEVIEKKKRFASAYKNKVKADELWLVLHSHSLERDWPMSKPENNSQRKFELDLLRFGSKGRLSGFDKIIYIYIDGTVVTVLDAETTAPKKIELFDEDGYPATTHHGFGFNIDVPLPGLGERIYEFNNAQFQESILIPKDNWMQNGPPNIARPNFFVRAVVTAEGATVDLYRDGVKTEMGAILFEGSPGQSYNIFSVVEWGIQKQRYRVIF
jgi:hypothetical protein